MRYLRWAVVLFLVLASMATWVPRIRIAGIVPDLLVGVVLIVALRKGATWGVWTGVALGLLAGVEQPDALGRDALALGCAGLLVGRGSIGLDRHNPLVATGLLFVAAFLADAVRLLWVAGGVGDYPLLWLRWALPGALYTTLVVPLLAWTGCRLAGLRGWMPDAP